MQKNDELILKIEDMGVDGAGIGKSDGMTFFVKDAVIGDVVRAKIIKLKKTYGYARLMELLEGIGGSCRTELSVLQTVWRVSDSGIVLRKTVRIQRK